MVTVQSMALNGTLPQPPLSAIAHPTHEVHLENGREYHAFLKGTYMYPCDEAEKDRLDLFHTFFKTARDNRHFSSRLIPRYDGLRILDIGCGTGIWAIDVADLFPDSEVVGWDLSLIQPPTIPANLSFRQRDFERPWHGIGEDAWDMIHMRMLAGSVGSWNELFHKAFRHLKPGYGCLESVEINFQPRCDDNTLSPNSALHVWWRELAEATHMAYKPLSLPQAGPMLQTLGYTDIRHEVIRLPCNPAWPTLPHEREIGRWCSVGMERGLQALTLGPLHRVKHWTKQQVDDLVNAVHKQLSSRQCHVYFEMHIWTARKPGLVYDPSPVSGRDPKASERR